MKKEFGGKKKDDDTNDGAGGRRPPGDNNNAFQDHNKVVATIFGGPASTESKREQKLAARRVLTVTTGQATANPSYRPWSEVPITFSRADQWADIPYTGRFPLVLDTTIQKVLFRKVLVDGGSALNLLFAGALKELGLGVADLTPSDSSFWGVVPGKASKPLGEITLPVQFGTANNYRIEHINFYVADFNTAYHAILGRPALAKFMAVPHYAYLVLKMPSPAGVLALRANLSIAYTCETESLALAEATDLSIQMASVVAEAKTVPADDMKIPEQEPPRASAKSKEVKEVGLGLDDPSKTVKIGAHLDPK